MTLCECELNLMLLIAALCSLCDILKLQKLCLSGPKSCKFTPKVYWTRLDHTAN